MEKWLYGLFMKIVLPTNRPTQHLKLIYSPLNMTVLFRILETLHENGYPAHWLEDVLVTLLSNRVKTTARPPLTYPLKITETTKDFADAHVDLSPFVTELRTLTGLWLAELPLALPAQCTFLQCRVSNCMRCRSRIQGGVETPKLLYLHRSSATLTV